MAEYELFVQPEVSDIPRVIDWVGECCGAEGIAGDLLFKMTLAIEEAIVNVINNAFAGQPPPHVIRLRLDIGAGRIVAEVSDNGRAFDPLSVPDPDLSLPIEQRDPGGLGIHLMRNMVDRLDYRHSDGHNHLRLEKARE